MHSILGYLSLNSGCAKLCCFKPTTSAARKPAPHKSILSLSQAALIPSMPMIAGSKENNSKLKM